VRVTVRVKSEELGAKEKSLEVSGIALAIPLVRYFICNIFPFSTFYISSIYLAKFLAYSISFDCILFS